MVDDTCANPECHRPPRIKGASGPGSPYCGTKCRNRADYLRNRDRRLAEAREASAQARRSKPCQQCGDEFTPDRTSQIYCTRTCNNRAQRDSSSKICVDAGCERPVRAKGLCAKHYKTTRPRTKDRMTDARRANLRRKTQQRRARLKGDADAESIDRDEIGARDGWRCGLCSRRIDASLAWPHPQSASLDHIEPLSVGGKHTRSNVQIAHLTCNVAKGNRGGGEQLLLIG